MDFLKECAERLKNEPAESVLKDMRERYTTVRCLRVKTGLVRKMYNGPDSEEFETALSQLLSNYSDEKREWIISITKLDKGKGPWYGIKSLKNSKYPEIAEELKKLPRRLPKNVWNLSITPKELKECKKLATEVKLKTNSKRLKVDGINILNHCRYVIDNYKNFTMYELALSIIFLTGRRTCEIMNGKSSFIETETPFFVDFEGQLKKKNSETYSIPFLYNPSSIHKAFEHLKVLQKNIPSENSQVTSKYASGLRQYLLQHVIFKQAVKIHNLRKTYACLCLKLFDWGEPSDLYICMHILGHNDLTEPIVYNVIDVGVVPDELFLGPGLLKA
jgi:integrase